MKQTFLYRLFNHSKLGFVVLTCFVIVYFTLFLKKMDMTFFAYNSMFTWPMNDKKVNAYAIKLNGTLIPISNQLWWKRDFLESTAAIYCKYIEKGKRVYLDEYLAYRIKDSTRRNFLSTHLTAQNISPEQWVKFYITFANKIPVTGESFELIRYEIEFTRIGSLNIDSFSILKSRLP